MPPSIDSVIAFARKAFYRDGAEGEIVHELCDELERRGTRVARVTMSVSVPPRVCWYRELHYDPPVRREVQDPDETLADMLMSSAHTLCEFGYECWEACLGWNLTMALLLSAARSGWELVDA